MVVQTKNTYPGLVEPATAVYSPGAQLALRAYFVALGDEARFLQELIRLPNVLVASLNYIGVPADIKEQASQEDARPFTPHRDAIWFLNDSKSRQPVFQGGISRNLRVPGDRPEKALVAVVDPQLKHCEKVVQTIIDAYVTEPETEKGPMPLVLALCLKDFHDKMTIDLWTFSSLILALCDVQARIVAINLSVHLGAMCGTIEGLPSPLATWVYSFPLFERLLDELILARRRLGDDPPLVFAAAGNLDTKEKQWRLAYPAVLPDAIAVTQAKERDRQIESLPEIDLPAVSPLKPCFSEPPRPGMKDVGTSFACAALAGRWAFWDMHFSLHQKNLGQFEKLALLVNLSDGMELRIPDSEAPNMPKPWVPCMIRQLRRNRARQGVKPRGSFFTQLLAQLNNEFHLREFLLTGSGAYVDTWLDSRATETGSLTLEQRTKAFKLLGDLDLLYTGADLDSGEYQKIRAVVCSWLEKEGQKAIEWEARIQIHAVRQWAGGIHLLQCIIPAACIFLTAAGAINPWSVGPDPLDDGPLQFFPPPEHAWEWNPQFRSGASGLAHAMLIWLNLNVIRAHLQKLFSGH
jgi:hypothetical protein